MNWLTITFIYESRLIATLAEMATTNQFKFQIFQYEDKSWIQKQALDNLENFKSSFFLNIRGRLFFSSFEFGHHVLDMKNLTFVSFPAWIDTYTLMNSRSLSIINLTKNIVKNY